MARRCGLGRRILPVEAHEHPVQVGVFALHGLRVHEEGLAGDGEELLLGLRAIGVEHGLFVALDALREGLELPPQQPPPFRRGAAIGYNVVIHEFAHVLDMADGLPDGVPLLPAENLTTKKKPVLRYPVTLSGRLDWDNGGFDIQAQMP